MARADLIGAALTPRDLAAVPLFHGCDDATLERVAAAVRRALYPAGTILMSEEQPSEVAYVVLEGTVKISTITPKGDVVLLAILGSGAIVGEMGVIENVGRSATVEVLERSTLIWIYHNDFRALLDEVPAIGRNLAAILSQRLRLTTAHLISLATDDLAARVARMLLTFAAVHGRPHENGSTRIPLRLTQSDIASLTGANRSRVNQVINAFRTAGLLTVDRGYHMTIRNTDGLRAYLC